MSEWQNTSLGSLGQVITGKTPSKDNPEDWGGHMLFVTPTDYKNYTKFGYSSTRMLSLIGSNRQKARVLPVKSVLVTCIGSDMGKSVINYFPCVSNQQINAIVPNQSVSDNDFVYYLTRQLYDVFRSLGGDGTAVPILNKSAFENISVEIPPLPEQKAIAAVLSSLDDKIDLLHRQNKTLEAMAETLFRQWFIEEAKEDWEEKSLTQIAVFLNGLACQKYPVKNELDKLPVLKIKELSAGITENSDWVANDIKPDYIIEAGDVIFAWSASLMVKIWNGPKCALNQHLFKVSSVEYPKWFYLHWCKYHLAEFISIASSHSTTMGHIKRADLDAAMVLVPKDNELNEMTEIIEPLFMKQIEISKQIQTLEKLRDNLLPKLMSGEVKVAI